MQNGSFMMKIQEKAPRTHGKHITIQNIEHGAKQHVMLNAMD
jgi:hypothetical protein